MKKKIIDANYLLRYFLCDNVEQNALATEIIENENIILLNEVLAEVCYVLEKVYAVPRIEISEIIQSLVDFDNIIAQEQVIRKTLELYSFKNLDFVDALLVAYNHIEKAKVYSFDKKLNKLLK